MADSRPFCFISAKFVTGYRCVIPQPTFSFISMIQFFALFLSYVNVLKLLKFKMAALTRSFTDIDEHICHIKRRSDGTFS